MSTRYDVPLFHWTPTTNRKRIVKLGLVPGRPSMTSDWTAPYVCFAETPSWAWALSGDFHPEVPEWDLWQTSMNRIVAPQRLKTFDMQHRWHEVRTNERVFKRDLWYVATRTTTPRNNT